MTTPHRELEVRQPSAPEVRQVAPRLPYVPPRLERRGDVRTGVLGPSTGVGDSPLGRIGA